MADRDSDSQAPPGAWIFVSHSHKDIEGVRAVRDELERMGHYPLLFFLKCVSEHDELDGLIQREIAARNFFLLCDSPSARASGWVRREVEYIKSLPDRVWRTVDLESDWMTQLRAVRELSEHATVFLSYSHREAATVEPLRAALEAAEYRVWNAKSIKPGTRWADEIQRGIADAMHDGFVVQFVTADALSSEVVGRELETALHLAAVDPKGRGRIIPVLLHDGDSSARSVPRALQSLQFLDLRGLPADEAGRRLVARLRQG